MIETPKLQCWLEAEDGKRIPVGPRGLIIGRSLASDVMLADAAASRRSAFIYQDLEGLWLVKVGRSSVRVGHSEVEDTQALRPGDTVHFPGAAYVVQADDDEAALADVSWALRRESAPAELHDLPRVLPLGDQPVTLGGGPEDDLRIPSWPPGLVRLEPIKGGGWSARLREGVSVDGAPVRSDTSRDLTADARIGYARVVFRLVEVAATQRDTQQQLPIELPSRVALQPLVPSGGSITLGFGEAEVTTWVPGVRYDVLQALLSPPAPYQAGDPLPDAVLMPLVWGRQLPSDRKAVVTVLKRLRRDLEKAGLAGSLLVDRSQGRSRFCLAPGALVEILDPR
jgi:hypothetical protein